MPDDDGFKTIDSESLDCHVRPLNEECTKKRERKLKRGALAVVRGDGGHGCCTSLSLAAPRST